MPKDTRRRSSSQIARDRQREADLYLQGWLQVDIAAELGIDQSTVSRDLKALQKDWLNSALRDFDELKAQELAKIDRLEREYWRAWERSCEDTETLRQEGKPEEVAKIVKTAKGQAGNPQFLQGVQWCIERRCKVLGVEAASKLDVTTGGKAIRFTVHGLGDKDI